MSVRQSKTKSTESDPVAAPTEAETESPFTRRDVRLVIESTSAETRMIKFVGRNGAATSEELANTFGTTDVDFLENLLRQIIGNDQEIDKQRIGFVLSVISGIKPRDQMEAMLAAQIAGVHLATMSLGRRLTNVSTLEEQDSATNAHTKLSRTFTAQMEALKRYRTGGEQKVTVQHVTVSEGGNAIVGNVTQAARAPAREDDPVALIEKSKVAPMPNLELEREQTATRVRRKAGK
jgi:hypothetical protein